MRGVHGHRPALILDANLRQSLVAVRSLGRAGVRVFVAETHSRAPAFRSHWCSGSEVLPDFAHDVDAFVDRLIALCERLGSPVIITSHDGTIEALRSRRPELERVASLALASEEALTAAVDKRLTLAIAERVGVPIPAGVAITETSMANGAVDAAGLPVVIKPVMSWVDEGPVAWRAAPSLAKTREAALEQIAALVDGGVGALVQPWLSGSREAVSILWADGRPWATFAQRADRMSPLIGGSSVLRESIPVPADIGPMSETLIRELALEGYSEIEFRRDADGRPFLMEINPRLSASVEIAVRSGVDFPLLLYQWAAGEPLIPVTSYRCGRRMRWLKGDVEWLKEALRDPEHPDAPTPARAVGSFLTGFAWGTGYDYWDRGDMRPPLLVASRVARSLPARLSGLLRRRTSPGAAPDVAGSGSE